MTPQRCGTVAPPRRCSNEWTNPRGYIVPRDMRVTLPAGFTFAGPVLTVALSPRSAPVTLDGSEWGVEVAPLVRMLLILPAVSASLMVMPSNGSKSMPRMERLKVCRPVFFAFYAGDTLAVQAVSARGGELLVAPLQGEHPSWPECGVRRTRPTTS